MLLKTFIYHPKFSGTLTHGRVVFPPLDYSSPLSLESAPLNLSFYFVFFLDDPLLFFYDLIEVCTRQSGIEAVINNALRHPRG